MIVTVLASAISSIAAYWLFHDTIYGRLRRVEATPAAKRSEAYAERLSHLTNDLTRASRDLDSVLAEVTEVVREREAAVGRLERELGNLELREQELQERITSLQGVPLPVVEHFASITTEGERRSAHRDYRLFIAGVVVSTITSLAFYILGSP